MASPAEDAMLYLLAKAFEGPGIEESNESPKSYGVTGHAPLSAVASRSLRER